MVMLRFDGGLSEGEFVSLQCLTPPPIVLYEAGRHLSLKIMNHMISKVYFIRVGKILYYVARLTTQ